MTSHHQPEALVRITPAGLFCERGGFHIDPWQPVERALLTHGHGDHAQPGSSSYLTVAQGQAIARKRLGEDAVIETLRYGERRHLGDVTVSFHPAGHVLGSAQLRIEHRGEVWVVSGDYKRQFDPTCEPFEPIACHTFITEATFGLPIYRWEPTLTVLEGLLAWWEHNREQGRASVLFCYALGKAQRLLAELVHLTDRTVFVHGAVESLVELYRSAGVEMLPTRKVVDEDKKKSFAGALILAPPSVHGSTWMRRLGPHETALASGWMRVRGNRRRRGYDRGFAISDHADWPALLKSIDESRAERILVTHGTSDALARFLRERGRDAEALETPYGREELA